MTINDKLPPLRDVIREYGLGAKKSLGQHFLLDANLTDRIARAAGSLQGKAVLEIGPGPGGLTRSILAQDPATLHAIERDQRCIEALSGLKSAYPNALQIVETDALKLEISTLSPRPSIIISNLPYNIGTALLLNWMTDLTGIERMILMFQKEVAERICAMPGTSNYGRLAIITQLLCETRVLFNVDKRAFTPPPKVMSAVVEITPRPKPLIKTDVKKLETVTRAAFGQRRKMLRSSLKTLGIDPADIGIDPQLRAEQLTIQQFCDLTTLLKESD